MFQVYFQHCRQEVENGDERTDEINQQLNQLAIMSGELSLRAPMYKTLPTPRIGLFYQAINTTYIRGWGSLSIIVCVHHTMVRVMVFKPLSTIFQLHCSS
jgi:hypothetical protein